jgi:hypothetical protein
MLGTKQAHWITLLKRAFTFALGDSSLEMLSTASYIQQ